MAELEEMLRKEHGFKDIKYEKCEKGDKQRKEEIEKEAEIEQQRREVERGKMEISKLNKLLEQY